MKRSICLFRKINMCLGTEAWPSIFEKCPPWSKQLCSENYGLQHALQSMDSSTLLQTAEARLQWHSAISLCDISLSNPEFTSSLSLSRMSLTYICVDNANFCILRGQREKQWAYDSGFKTLENLPLSLLLRATLHFWKKVVADLS